MASWKFFEWLAYASILVGAVILAADAALKGSPTLMPHLPDWIKSEYWSFAPFALLMLSGAILLAKAIRARVGTPGRSPPGHAPSQPAGDNASPLPSQRLSARRQTASISAPVPSLLSLEQALVPQDAYYLDDEDAKGYPHKLKIVLTNESAGDIIVTPAEWRNIWNFTSPPLNEHPWQPEGPHGWQRNVDWGDETHQPLLVRPGRAIQTWVGLPARLEEVELRRRIMTKRLGTLIVPFTIDGRTTSQTITL